MNIFIYLFIYIYIYKIICDNMFSLNQKCSNFITPPQNQKKYKIFEFKGKKLLSTGATFIKVAHKFMAHVSCGSYLFEYKIIIKFN